MLTNPGETQLVTSLGIKVGKAKEAGDTAAPKSSGCPFAAMLASGDTASEKGSVREAEDVISWSAEARTRLTQVPEFVRPMAMAGIEKYAKGKGLREITVKVLEEAKEHFGL